MRDDAKRPSPETWLGDTTAEAEQSPDPVIARARARVAALRTRMTVAEILADRDADRP